MSQSGDFRRTYGKTVTEALLKKAQSEGIEVDAIYAHNDDMAIGAIQAVEDAGLKPGTDIIILSIDGVKAAFEAMKENKLNCTVECNPLLGPKAFDAVEAILAGKTLDKWTKMPTRYFEPPVSDELLAGRKY
jgi:simple sugar transport system substrate-binding protein